MFKNRIIDDITDYIFVSDKPEKSDIIFLPGGSFSYQGEYAAKLYRNEYASLLMLSGGISVKLGEWQGVKEKADIYNGDLSLPATVINLSGI